MQNPAQLRINRLALVDGAEVALAPEDLDSIIFSWDANTNKLYTLIFGHNFEDGIVPELVIANIPGNNVSEGDILLSYPGPWPGEGRVIIFEQQISYAPNPMARGTKLLYQQLMQAGLVPYISVGTFVAESGADAGGPYRGPRGGLVAALRGAINRDYYVDVTNLQLSATGTRVKLVKRSDAPISLTNVPNFPIISRSSEKWDFAMQIIANSSNNPGLWNNLLGKWGQAVANPQNYSRARLLETIEQPMKITYLEPGTKLL